MKKQFRSTADALEWLSQLRKALPKCADNTDEAWNAITLRSGYPVEFKLPERTKLVGVLSMETKLNSGSLAKLEPKYISELGKLTALAESVSFLFWYRRPGNNMDKIVGYRLEATGPNIQFESGYLATEVEESIKSYAGLFKTFGLKAQFVKGNDTFQIVPEKGLAIDVQVRGHGGGPEIIICPIKETNSEKILEKLFGMITNNGWKISSSELFVSFPAPKQKGATAPSKVLSALNNAKYPFSRVKAELWVSIASWKELDALAELAEMDVERSGFDLEILRVALASGRKGYVIAKPKKGKAFEVRIRAASDADENEFQKELARTLKSM